MYYSIGTVKENKNQRGLFMDIEIGFLYNGMDIIIHVTNLYYSPYYQGNMDEPSEPAEVIPTDGWIELDIKNKPFIKRIVESQFDDSGLFDKLCSEHETEIEEILFKYIEDEKNEYELEYKIEYSEMSDIPIIFN